MKLELSIMAGAESKQFLAGLTKQLDRMEALVKVAGVEEDADTEDTDDEEEVAAKPAKKKAAASFDDDEEEESDEDADDSEDEEEEAPVKKKKTAAKFEEDDEDGEDTDDEEEVSAKPAKKKAPKLTADDVQDACKAHVKYLVAKKKKTGQEARAAVVGILKKHFKTTSVSSLKPEQFAPAIKILKV